MTATFADRVLAWFDRHGRTDLPWQMDPTPYRVWVSEIMLQQTQVATVVLYYDRFMQRFPTVEHLAGAPLDAVLHHWSGLGYYARARNLHRAAGLVCSRFGGQFPADPEDLQSLPGIGRSTAGAILSLALGQRQPILDGNVKRVLARHAAVPGWPGRSQPLKRLWELAAERTPAARVAAYNQAMMDLGATVCTRGRPACSVCPVAADCRALQAGRVADFPTGRPRKALPARPVRMLLVRDRAGAVFLQRRPPSGIWGGLWGLPEIAADADPARWCLDTFSQAPAAQRLLSPRRHTFSHFHLDIEPVEILLNHPGCVVMEAGRDLWYKPENPESVGLAAPVARLLQEIARPNCSGESNG